jgi:hypothetical protein
MNCTQQEGGWTWPHKLGAQPEARAVGNMAPWTKFVILRQKVLGDQRFSKHSTIKMSYNPVTTKSTRGGEKELGEGRRRS